MNRRLSFVTLVLILAVILGGSSVASAQLGNLSRAVGMIKGDVVGEDGASLAGISVTILRGTERVTTTKTKPDGKFTNILQPNGMYRFVVNESQYAYHEDTLMVPALDKYKEYYLRIELTRLHDGDPFSLNDPVFLPGSSTIGDAAMTRLNAIVELIRHNVKLSLNITVYPDLPIQGKQSSAQQALADGRSTALRSFFLGKTIPAARFSVSVGSTIPAGRFSIPGVKPPVAPVEPPSKKGKKGKTEPHVSAPPPSNGLIPQYVEIVARLAS